MISAPSIYCYQSFEETDFVESIKQQLKKNKKPVLRCYMCYEAITGLQEKIQIMGSHCHQFINPADFEFQIACFREAFGCMQQGFPTMEHTWFPGYCWQMALCHQCLEHLGWYFSNNTHRYDTDNSASFYGLILNKLILHDSPSDY